MNGLRNFAGQLGPKRLMMMAGVGGALLLLLGYLAFRTPAAEMGYLYTDLDPGAAQSITEKLKADGVPFQISADGTGVMAPQERLAELRMSLAGEQIGGKIGYDVLDQEEPFGVSSSRAKLNETRAIEGELVRSIESLESVLKARVHIVMPDRPMFAAEARKASAAVTVKTRGTLPSEGVQAIRYLVSSSVPELSPESVSIVDQSGALLARAGEGGGRDGDLYINVSLHPHAIFRVSGRDLYVDLPLAPWEAVLGTSVELPTPGGTVRLRIRAGTQAGQQLRLSKRGLPKPDHEGDLYAIVQIAVPDAVSDEEKALYEKLRETSKLDPRSHLKSETPSETGAD